MVLFVLVGGVYKILVLKVCRCDIFIWEQLIYIVQLSRLLQTPLDTGQPKTRICVSDNFSKLQWVYNGHHSCLTPVLIKCQSSPCQWLRRGWLLKRRQQLHNLGDRKILHVINIYQEAHDADLLQACVHFEVSKLPKYLTTLTLFRGRKWAAPTWISFFAALTFGPWHVSPD